MPNPPILRVALDLPLPGLFDFLLPDFPPPTDDAGPLAGADRQSLLGRLAVVPFGPRKLVGLIVELAESSVLLPEKLKAALHIQTALPAFSAADLALFRFCESYYHFPLGQIVANALPPAMRLPRPIALPMPRMLALSAAGRDALPSLRSNARVQQAILQSLSDHGSQLEASLRTRLDGAATAIPTLLKRGWIELAAEVGIEPAPDRISGLPSTVDAGVDRIAPGSGSTADFVQSARLNAEQATAVAAISVAAGFAPILLAGITGSGKTEVYLHAIHHALLRNRQALVLVPEINLSPAFVRAVAARFPGATVAELHSGMSDQARLRGFVDAQRGHADIVIGTRMAVFTPLPRLGLIVVDEEHDASYKQQEGFRYSARDVAVFRARQAGCAVVLGSATPSLETLYNAGRERFTELALTQRAAGNARLPQVDFIDLNAERASEGLTASLVRAIDATVARGEQALVFINRRGYAPALACAQCGWMPECQRCTARLVYHRGDRKMKCHHCGFQARVPEVCEKCGSHELVAAGHGTERVEVALQAALRQSRPNVRMTRVDRDSTRRRGSAETIFAAAAAGQIDVLIGTQMLSKGHDFPRLTLVGVVNADGAMFSADFRAAERLAAQLMQVAGRAGRAELPGQVLIQTRFPNHPLYQAVAAHDYRRFAEIALDERRHAHLPPYTFLALLRAESHQAVPLADFMQLAAQSAHALVADDAVQVWDPVPPTMARKAGYERRQLMVQANSRRALQRFLAQWIPQVRAVELRTVKWLVDVDPLEV
jgi:primosomal protein N' (replication factor Y)